MKTIQVLGPGCAKCVTLVEHAKKAVAESGADYEVVKISDINQIMSFGVMVTPALAIEGQVKSAGKVLTVDEIKRLLQA
jgi:small redox-active disulfide protein 2